MEIKEQQIRAQEREEKKKLRRQKKSVKPRKSTNMVGESSTSLRGLQREEISNDKCAMCLGAYQVDNGELVREWLQCTSQNCDKWMRQNGW